MRIQDEQLLLALMRVAVDVQEGGAKTLAWAEGVVKVAVATEVAVEMEMAAEAKTLAWLEDL